MFDKEKAVVASEAGTWSATMEVTVVNGEPVCKDTDVPEGAKKVKLDWEMVTPGWEILGIHGLPYPMFTNKAKDGYDYKCKDKNNNVGEKDYKYTIIVGDTTTKVVVSKDPTVKNGGIK